MVFLLVSVQSLYPIILEEFFSVWFFFVFLFLCFKSMQAIDSFEKHKTAFLHLQGDSQRVIS